MKLPLLCFLVVITVTLFQRIESQSTFNIAEHTEYIYLSYAAFCPDYELMQWNCSWCKKAPYYKIKGTVTDYWTEVFGYVAYCPANRTILVSFRGSANFPNRIIDGEFWETADYPDMPDVQVHAGFHQGYFAVQAQVRQLVAEILKVDCPQCTTILHTGHSLGAALSGLCALDLGILYANNSAITIRMSNFGMPRVGNDLFAKIFHTYVKGPSWRVVHYQDMVPHFPPQLVLGYHHVSTEVWEADEAGTIYKVCDASGEDPNCSDQVEPWDYAPSDHMYYMKIHQDNCVNG